MSVKDQEGIPMKVGELVFYSGEVWKIGSITLRKDEEYDLLNLKNTNGIRNGVSPKNVGALGRDTISGMGSNGANKHPLLKFKVGDHVCTKSGRFRTGKVTAVTQDKVTFEVWEDGTCKEVTYKANAVDRTGRLAASVSAYTASVVDHVRSDNDSFSLGSQGRVKWSEGSREHHMWWDKSSPKESKEPEKKDSISVGELIEDETRRLSREGGPPNEGEENKPPKVVIKKRKGEW
jgi:preprotein translocase subunit YajC